MLVLHILPSENIAGNKNTEFESDIDVAVEMFCVKARQLSYCTSTSKAEGQTNTSKLKENMSIYLIFHWKEPFVS